jgi:fructosamine-3-kinase
MDEPLREALEPVCGPLAPEPLLPVGGGSINRSFVVTRRDGGRFFLKCNAADRGAMFEAEAAGLTALAGARAVRVPEPLGYGITGSTAWLLLEFLPLGPSADDCAARELGRRLARQHRVTADRFGWSQDNTIGLTPQRNGWMDDWIDFLRERRLAFQLDLAAAQGYGPRLEDRGRRLLELLPRLFADYMPAPSLLHGDLWGGNWGALDGGEPVIFDPAVYFGDREADLAMTMLFGGFGPEFQRAYAAEWPLHDGFAQRCDLYNLYHVLNHLNLFGDAYLHRAESMLDALLTACRGRRTT